MLQRRYVHTQQPRAIILARTAVSHTHNYMYHALQGIEKFSSISTKKDIQKQSMKQQIN